LTPGAKLCEGCGLDARVLAQLDRLKDRVSLLRADVESKVSLLAANIERMRE
jgi:hypothetical protein